MKIKVLLLLLFLFITGSAVAGELPLSLFPLQNYNQHIDYWLNPQAPDYKSHLMDLNTQKQYAKDFYNHLYAIDESGLSPWSKAYVEKFVAQLGDLPAAVKNLLTGFNHLGTNSKDIIYGENFRPYGQEWFDAMEASLNLQQFSKPFKFSAAHRAILVRNALVRVLPTREVGFYSYERAGEGYPFDNFQTSALWVGAPVYLLGQTTNGSWSFIIADSFMGWVETDALAVVSDEFMRAWQKYAPRKLLAVIHTETPIVNQHKIFQHLTYVGTVLPFVAQTSSTWKVLVPYRDGNGVAHLRYGYIAHDNADLLPLAITRANFARLFKTLQGRPYGWGGAYFYNDCSQELKSMYTAFGIWLPRNSTDQVLAKEGKMIDLSANSAEQRIAYLMDNGKPLTTVVNIGGHVFLYVGNYPNPNAPKHDLMVMTYQNMWGLKPTGNNMREVVGGAIFFPLLRSYPEDPAIESEAGRKIFKVMFLGEGFDGHLSGVQR